MYNTHTHTHKIRINIYKRVSRIIQNNNAHATAREQETRTNGTFLFFKKKKNDNILEELRNFKKQKSYFSVTHYKLKMLKKHTVIVIGLRCLNDIFHIFFLSSFYRARSGPRVNINSFRMTYTNRIHFAYYVRVFKGFFINNCIFR